MTSTSGFFSKKINHHFQGIFMKMLVLVSCLFLASCGWFKKAPKDDKVYKEGEELEEIRGKKVYNPETGEYEYVKDVTGEMDTVKWTELPEDDFPPITSETDPTTIEPTKPGEIITPAGSVKKSVYNVTVILPFLTQNFDPFAASLYENSLWAVRYYAGTKMALDRLADEGLNLNVKVLDSKASVTESRKLIKENADLAKADLIIGPYRRDNVALLADFAKEKNITYVSPYSASSGLSQRNPNYIQVNPSLESHITAITKHVRKSYKPSQVILVARSKDSESARFEYFHKANAEITGKRDTNRFRELLISDDLTNFTEANLKPFIKEGSTTVFIVPSWSSEAFVGNFLRALDLARGQNQVVVYGMPQWIDFQNIDYDYYEKMNVLVSSATYLNADSPDARFFKKNYFEKYGTVPREESYMGYDNMLYFGRMLKKYGTKFQSQLELEKEKGLLLTYQIEPVITLTPLGAEGKPVIEQYENKAVNILRFKNYQFKPVE